MRRTLASRHVETDDLYAFSDQHSTGLPDDRQDIPV
jgi:hypothetical protein